MKVDANKLGSGASTSSLYLCKQLRTNIKEILETDKKEKSASSEFFCAWKLTALFFHDIIESY